MEKAFEKIDFFNKRKPALNETNLNKITTAIDTIDDRVVELNDAMENNDNILPVEKGGTGNAEGIAQKAFRLVNAVNIKVLLSNRQPAAFDGRGGVTPGVEGVLALANGGTGSSNPATALNNLTSNASYEPLSYEFDDDDSVLWLHTSGNGSGETYQTQFLKIWDYIKTKINSENIWPDPPDGVIHETESNANGDGNVNVITDIYLKYVGWQQQDAYDGAMNIIFPNTNSYSYAYIVVARGASSTASDTGNNDYGRVIFIERCRDTGKWVTSTLGTYYSGTTARFSVNKDAEDITIKVPKGSWASADLYSVKRYNG